MFDWPREIYKVLNKLSFVGDNMNIYKLHNHLYVQLAHDNRNGVVY